MVELIVVIGIIILAAGMMTPSITDFFKSRQLVELVREVRGVINNARLKAVNERSEVHVVFFKEGLRLFDPKVNGFVDEYWDPSTSVLSSGKAWLLLGFLDDRPSTELTPYASWAEKNMPEEPLEVDGEEKKKKKAVNPRIVDISTLPRITFQRDGSIAYPGGGNDVGSQAYKTETSADLLVFAQDNPSICFIDLLVSGQNRSKLVLTDTPALSPEDYEAKQKAANESKKKSKRKKRKGKS